MSSRKHSPALCAVFFLSGAAALIFETLWFRRAGLAFGNSVWASALVLSSFMAGLALGSGLAARYGHRIRRPERLYALIEILVATTGIGLVFLFPLLPDLLRPVFSPLLGQTTLLNGIRLGSSFLLLMVPATAMGMTLPVLVKALLGDSGNFGQALGQLYGWNTLGAVAGALLGETVLIEAFGMTGTSLWAGAFNVLAAGGALAVAGTVAVAPKAAAVRAPISARARRLLFASFLSGGVLLALEVIWFRFLQLFFQGTTLTFALMLSVVLGGIGLGGLLAAWWFRVSADAHRRAPAIALLAGVASIQVYALFDLWLGDRTETRVTGYGLDDIQLFFVLMFPVALLSGILFSLIGAAAHEEIGDETRATGLVTMVNTIGGALGPVIAGFALIPWLGMERSFFGLATVYAVVALCTTDSATLRAPWRRPIEALLAVGLVAAVALFPFGHMDRYIQIASGAYTSDDNSEIAEVREGLTETIQYLRKDFLGQPHDYRLVTNSYSMSGTHWGAKRYMKYYVYWPIAVHPDPKDALLISFGCGSTTKALTDTKSLESIVVVDISKEILDMVSIIYEDRDNPLNDPRVDVYLEDGRFYLQTTDRRFDIITGDPPPPKAAGIVNLCTQEYFQLIHDRLAEGGVATYWLPAMQFEDAEIKSLLKGFLNVFGDEASLWSAIGLTWVMVGTRNAEGPVPAEAFARQWDDPLIGPEMRSLGYEDPAQIGATFMMDADDLRELTADSEPLTDNYPKRLSSRIGTGALPENLAAYATYMDAQACRERFEESEYIKRLWPASLIQESLPYFRIQGMISAITVPSPKQGQIDFPELHHVLTNTALRMPVLWAMGSNARQQEIAEQVGPDGPRPKARAFQLAVRAMADRDYAEAVRLLEESEGRRPNPQRLFTRVFLLCMDERDDEARTLVMANKQIFGHMAGRSLLDWLSRELGFER